MSLPDRNIPIPSALSWVAEKRRLLWGGLVFQKLLRLYTGRRLSNWTGSPHLFKKGIISLADFSEASLPENRPYLMHYDGHKNRIDRIVRPYEIAVMEKEVFGEAWFADTLRLDRFMKLYILSQNRRPECAAHWSDMGMAALLEKYANAGTRLSSTI